ncbi:hypothetical protein FOYG_16614 [Fusarium oxysporum NRRL 32931]|uniref:Uncharacterized protein n=1 Tax=Fusarium oxysporum NRRL 32931 TaxID=660029 RepID=W9HI59_FUSOX|nr:hypothetical protein FOYG_16614 [Fusarium oxysporum NRRL 32931]
MEKANIGSFHELRSVNIKALEGIDKLKQLQLDQMKIVRDQRRLADAQSEMNESGRKMATEQQRLASANERNAIANQQNAAANMASAVIASDAMNAFMRLSQEYLISLTALNGGIGPIKSLTTQLLRQHGFDDADLDKVAQEVNLPLLKSGVEDIEDLCQLFAVLVRRLRNNITLFYVIDSVNVYEDEDILQDMLCGESTLWDPTVDGRHKGQDTCQDSFHESHRHEHNLESVQREGYTFYA